ncbi:MAG: hypothetical protein ACYC3F_17090 [Gemmatimonadaceae bacterium]
MALVHVPLTAGERTLVAIAQRQHAQMIHAADAERDAMLADLLADKGIPPKAIVTVDAQGLAYDDGLPDAPPPEDPPAA